VAVASVDEGYESTALKVRINAGDEVISALRANDQFDWQFVSEDEALAGVTSGDYYAALIIPKDFSANLMEVFATGKATSSTILYYDNEKENAIAQRVTSTGATTLQDTIDKTFTQTVANVALDATSSLSSFMTGDGILSYSKTLISELDTTTSNLRAAAEHANTYAALLGSTSALVDATANALHAASDEVESSAAEAQNKADSAQDEASSKAKAAQQEAEDSLEESRTKLQKALVVAREALDALPNDNVTGNEGDSSTGADDSADSTSSDDSADSASDPDDSADSASDSNNSSNSDSTDNADDADDANDADDNTASKEDLEEDLDDLEQNINSASNSTEKLEKSLSEATSSLTSSADSLSDNLGKAQATLKSVASTVSKAADTLSDLRDKLQAAVDDGDLEQIQKLIGDNPSTLAQFLAAPTAIDRHAVYPMNNNGSAMSPFYTSLCLWIGAIFMVALMQVQVSPERLEMLRKRFGREPKPAEIYLGRYGVFALIGLGQALIVGLGNVFYLGVTCEHVWLYLAACCLTSLVFTNLVYTFTVSFGNIGKALAIVGLVVQLGGAGGLMPVQMLAPFFQEVYPWLPFAHSMEAMQGAMAGIYGLQYATSMGMLALFLVPSLALGLIFRRPIIKANDWMLEKLDEAEFL
jgi:putative membrane protein